MEKILITSITPRLMVPGRVFCVSLEGVVDVAKEGAGLQARALWGMGGRRGGRGGRGKNEQWARHYICVAKAHTLSGAQDLAGYDEIAISSPCKLPWVFFLQTVDPGVT